MNSRVVHPGGARGGCVGDVLLRIETGKSVKTQERPARADELGILRLSAVTWGEFRPEENKAILEGYAPGDCPRPMDGDLLISRANTRELVGAPVIVRGNHPQLLLSDKILRLVPNLDRVEPRYLVRALRFSAARAHFESRAGGTSGSMTNITQDDIRSAPVPLLTLPEQRRIADILDRAEALRTKRRAALAQLDTITQSIFLDLFGDPATNIRGWPMNELQTVVKEGTLVTYGIVQAGEECPGGVPYIRTGDIVAGEIVQEGLRHTSADIASKFARSQVEAGDIVMSIRATVGTTACVPKSLDGANLTQGTAKIAPGNRTEGTYLLSFLRMDSTQHWISRQVKGATFREITLSRLRELPVLVPPLALQQDFARRIAAVEKLKAAQRASRDELDALFASLQHRAFRGEL